MELNERVEKLEKQLKCHRLLLGAALTLAVPFFLLGADSGTKGSLLKTPVQVVDPRGNPVLVIDSDTGTNTLNLYGPKQKGMTILSAGPEGTGLTISSDMKNPDPEVVILSMTDGSALLMNAPKGKKGVEIATAVDGGEIVAYDAQGKPRK